MGSSGMVTDYDVKMAMFNIKGGVLNTQLSTQVYRIAVDNSPDMNAFEYALLDSIRDLWVKKGDSTGHMITLGLPRVIGAGGGSFIQGDLLNTETSENMYKPKASDLGIRKT